jgi:hypothetical protein
MTIHLNDDLEIEIIRKYFLTKKHLIKIESTSKSIKFVDLEDKETYIVSEKGIRFGLMLLMQATKQDVIKNTEQMTIVPIRPEYSQSNKINFPAIQGEIKSVIELDLSKAYLESAYKQKFVSKNIYDKLFKVSSETRKHCLGSIATKKSINYYDETGKFLSNEIVEDEKLRAVWTHICAGTTSTMQEIINMNAQDRFLFYWVDNIFFMRESVYEVPNKFFQVSSKMINMPSGVPFKEYTHYNLIYTKLRDNLIQCELPDGRIFPIKI